MVGTTISVAEPSGIPFEKSSRGNRLGGIKHVDSQLTRDTPSWVAHRNNSPVAAQRLSPVMPVTDMTPQVTDTDRSNIVPR